MEKTPEKQTKTKSSGQPPVTTGAPDGKLFYPADITAGVVVFLVALPLCLGIALASSAPLFAGLISGIVGGIVVGALSGSSTSVSGPAAGLAAVVAAQISGLGSFEAFLLAVVIAGAMQVLLGVLRAGSIAAFVPTSVIKGLLAAIGLLLILKQIPHLFGHDSDPTGDMSFSQVNQENTFSALWRTLGDLHPAALVIGLSSLALLLLWQRSDKLKALPIPAPLIVVLGGVGGAIALTTFGEGWVLGKAHLVQVPVAANVSGFFGLFKLPDFSQLTNTAVYTGAITIAAVATLETLLNLEAVDKLDPRQRISPPNRELIAQGVGNIVAGMLGGLPITSVIVRSSVNINTGNRTKASALLHGVLLLVSVAVLPHWLNRIPLSCLAAILIATGLKLASPALFKQMWQSGRAEAARFLITVGMILATDLLIGILIGLAASVFSILNSNLRKPLTKIHEQHIGGEVTRIELSTQVSFLNRAALLKALDEVPPGGQVMLDARSTDYIDADVLTLIRDYENETAPARGVQVSLVGFREHYLLEDRTAYVDYTTREMHNKLVPAAVQQILVEGNERFAEGRPLIRDLRRQLDITSEDHHPLAIVLSGTSARTPVEVIFDVGLGDLRCVRTTGNVASHAALGSLEYAVVCGEGTKLIVVMGHTRNQAIVMAIEATLGIGEARARKAIGFLGPMLDDISNAIDPERVANWAELSSEERWELVDEVAVGHVKHELHHILEMSDTIRSLVEVGQIGIVGCMYDVQSGRVSWLDAPETPEGWHHEKAGEEKS
ncbi:MAG: sulfate transporter [Proteobacteria bacterium]|nr:MAG: sulfate transporter [Pseudomonadota bacterium]PIE19968.1 MAG: sulfate transporter [Pseudomonadota bacterium]